MENGVALTVDAADVVRLLEATVADVTDPVGRPAGDAR